MRTKNPLPEESQRGSVLLFCLGVLALLSMMGTALMFIARQEERVTRQYNDDTHALFAAESGIEAALAKISSYQGSLAYLPQELRVQPDDSSYKLEQLQQCSFGEFDKDGDGKKETSGYVAETYSEKGDIYKLRVQSTQGRLNLNDIDSFPNIDTDPYEDQSHPDRIYSSLPAHSRPPVNPLDYDNPGSPRLDKDPDWIYPGQSGYDSREAWVPGKPYPKGERRLYVMIRELISALFDDEDLAGKCAQLIMEARRDLSTGFFENLKEVQSILVPQYMTPDQWRLFQQNVTLRSWQDEKVLRPTFQWRISRPDTFPSDFYSDLPISWVWAMDADVGYMHSRPSFGSVFNVNLLATGLPDWFLEIMDPAELEEYLEILDLDQYAPGWTQGNDDNLRDIYLYSDMQTKMFDREARAPIDVNSASQALLKALVRPVEGWYLEEKPDTSDPEYTIATHWRVEDWSFPNGGLAGSHPWHYGYAKLCELLTPDLDWLGSLTMSGAYFHTGTDSMSYYYYDELHSAWLDFGTAAARYMQKNGCFGRLESVKIPRGIADAVAEKIHAAIHPDGNIYKPFLTWESFEHFLHGLCVEDVAGDIEYVPGLTDIMVSALIANFNPNSRINDFNPNKSHYLHVDKSQLIRNSAELCFHPMGYFEITSLGELHDAKGKIVASRKIHAELKGGFEVYRMTTQADFMQGYDPSVGSQASAMLTPSASVASARTGGLHYSGAGLDPSYMGHMIQSYPEPELDGGLNNIKNSAYDGYLMLSVYRPVRTELLGETNPISFQGDFTGKLQASYAVNGDIGLNADPVPGWINKIYPMHAQVWRQDSTDPSQPYPTGWKGITYWKPDASSKSPSNFPGARILTRPFSPAYDNISAGNLYVDGGYSDAGRSLAYNAKNFGYTTWTGRRGSVQFWLKPAFDVAYANRIRQFFTMAPKDYGPAHFPNDVPIPNGNPNKFPAGGNGVSYGAFGGTINPPGLPNPGGANPYSANISKAMGWDLTLNYFAHGGVNVLPDDPMNLQQVVPIYTPELGAGCFATRSLYFYANGDLPASGTQMDTKLFPSCGSDTANHSWKDLPESWTPMNFETRQWNSIGLTWNFSSATNKTLMTINGQEMLVNDQPTGTTPTNLHTLANGSSNYARFGESSSAPFRNVCADATYDVIASSSNAVIWGTLVEEYGFGRYFNDPEAKYNSPAIDLFKELRLNGGSLALHSIAWTLYWPKVPGNALPCDPRFNDNRASSPSTQYMPVPAVLTEPAASKQDPMTAHWGQPWVPVCVNFVNPSTGAWQFGDLPLGTLNMPHFSGGSTDSQWLNSPMAWRKGDLLRFRVHFNMDANIPLYASPILDDITFVFAARTSQIFFWDPNYQE